jgi:lipopolysaccharide/colanic/teichoic acid biosynthesis glycosyltransferase
MEKQYTIAGINLTDEEVFSLKEAFDHVDWVFFSNGFQFHKWMEGHGLPINMVITRGAFNSPNGYPLTQQLRKSALFKPESAIILIVDEITDVMREKAIHHGITELFDAETSTADALFRVKYLLENPVTKKSKSSEPVLTPYSIPWDKRLFDLFFAGMALLFLSPLFLLVAIAIRLESRGPVFYYSLRVGTGYKVFRFYKFRSMFTGADAKLKDLAHLNQYKEEAEKKKEQEEEVVTESGGSPTLYMDGKEISEAEYKRMKAEEDAGTFLKIKNDPRVTKVGKIIRNTSIDELPQLWNVIKGDMSIVGNRPLPLYEAEKLTTDRFSMRFLAPAGITGLWQVTKRGTSEMSEEERVELDNEYARNSGLWFDIKLILRTIPALLQSEDV